MQGNKQGGIGHGLLHDLMVVYCIPDINIGFKWYVCDSRVEVEDVWW